MVDRHSYTHTSGPGVAELLQRAIEHGEAVRLAWPDPHAPAMDRNDYPTAELPIVTGDDLAGGAR